MLIIIGGDQGTNVVEVSLAPYRAKTLVLSPKRYRKGLRMDAILEVDGQSWIGKLETDEA